MENRPNGRKSILMFVSSMLIFGTIGLFRRFIPLSSALLACSRGLLGGLFILAFLKIRRAKSEGKIPLRTGVWLAATGAVIGVNWILLFEAYNYTTVAAATLCYYMQPTIVMLLSPLLLKEKLTARRIVCAVIAIAGMVLISGVMGGEPQARNPRGILLGLGAAVCYAGVVIMNKRITGIDAYRKTTIQLLSAGIVMIPYLMLTEEFSPGQFSAGTVALLLVVGLVHTGIAYVLYFGSLEGMRAQSAAILSYIDPVSALLFSALFLREPLSVPSIVGAALIIGSAIASEIRNEKQASEIRNEKQ